MNVDNTSRPRQNGRYFADEIKYIFLDAYGCILIEFSLKFVLEGPVYNNSALVHITACRRINDKPLFEPMMAYFTDVFLP